MPRSHLHIRTARLFFAVSCFCFIASASAQEYSASDDVVGIEQMIRAAGSLRNFKPKDEFDAGPTLNTMTGKRFSVELKVAKNGCSGYPTWSYIRDSGKLWVSFHGSKIVSTGTYPAFLKLFSHAPGSYSTGHSLNYIPLNCVSSDQGSYIAGNAFGALTEVFKSKEVVLAISPTGIDETMYGKKSRFESQWEIKVSGDEARALSASLVMRISGTIGEWENGANVACGTDGLRADMLHPFESTFDACIYKANDFRVELIDSRSGNVVFETTNKATN